MATLLRERIFSPLSTAEARALVDEVTALIDASIEADGAREAAPDAGVDGFSLVPERGERDDEGFTALDVLDDVSVAVDERPPPTAAVIRGEAEAEGRTSSSLVLEPAALARLPSCRSTLTLEYYGRIFDKAPFVALQKLLFARVGAAVVSRGEGLLTTIEALVAERARDVGPTWAKTPPLCSREPPKKPLKTRPAKAGELEALAVYKRLARIIQGKDPLARDALKKLLEQATEPVRVYAAALMEDGPRPDAAVAKGLSCPVAEVLASREALGAILRGIK